MGSGNNLNNFSTIAVDMHSHLIPGIDDGVLTIDDSVSLARRMNELGYKKMITTPHVQHEFFKNSPDIILNGLDTVKEALQRNNIPLVLEASAEYLIDEGFEDILNDGKLLAFSDNYVLIELSYYNPHPNLKTIIFNLQIEGYKVILAHPERYSYWFNDFGKFEELKNRGVYFQVNLVSLSGYYPEPIKKFAEKLIDREMIDFAGSDLHSLNYLTALKQSLQERSFKKLLNSGKLLNAKL